MLVIFVVVTKENAAAAAADNDTDAVFLIKIEIDQGVVVVGSSRSSSIRYCC